MSDNIVEATANRKVISILQKARGMDVQGISAAVQNSIRAVDKSAEVQAEIAMRVLKQAMEAQQREAAALLATMTGTGTQVDLSA